jgi:hypothetical protein
MYDESSFRSDSNVRVVGVPQYGAERVLHKDDLAFSALAALGTRRMLPPTSNSP